MKYSIEGFPEAYRYSLIDTDSYPLPTVPFSEMGLLAALPNNFGAKKEWPWGIETSPKIYDKKKKWPKISIITPSYNQGKYIEETIRAVLLQNYPNLEYIVIDGGSTDGTLDVLKKYSKWISYWHSKPDKGQGHAINLGFSLSSGEYQGWINSDDYYSNGSLFRLGMEILKSKKDFYYGDALEINEDGSLRNYWKANLVLDKYYAFGGLIASHSAFWKREIHQPIWELMNCNVDGELWGRLLTGKKKKHIKFPIGVCRHQPDAKSISESWKQKWAEDDRNIHAKYGKPKKSVYLNYEFYYLQRIYKLLR